MSRMLAVIALLGIAFYAHGQRLSSYNVDASSISVSGFQSGASLATALHVSHSSLFGGVGLVAGSPYYCAQGEHGKMLTSCSFLPETFSLRTAIKKAEFNAEYGLVDPLLNLTDSRVYIYAGRFDPIISPQNGHNVEDFYNVFVRDRSLIKTVYHEASSHAFITDSYGNHCLKLAPPFINNCGYDQAGDILRHTTGLKLRERGYPSPLNIYTFNQSEFGAESLADKGFMYVPKSCQRGSSCAVHVALHGCLMSYSSPLARKQFVEHSGYNAWAESNDIIILYPQASSTRIVGGNIFGCWDFYGYTNPVGDDGAYVTKEGEQIKAIYEMVQRLISDDQ